MRNMLSTFSITLLVAACVHQYGGDVSKASHDWEGRNASDLSEALGPPDKITAVGDAKVFEWFRLGPCRVAAKTSTEGTIRAVTTEGSVEGCNAYREKLRIR